MILGDNRNISCGSLVTCMFSHTSKHAEYNVARDMSPSLAIASGALSIDLLHESLTASSTNNNNKKLKLSAEKWSVTPSFGSSLSVQHRLNSGNYGWCDTSTLSRIQIISEQCVWEENVSKSAKILIAKIQAKSNNTDSYKKPLKPYKPKSWKSKNSSWSTT